MIKRLLRQFGMLVIGWLIAFALAMRLDPARDLLALAIAILAPVALCLSRAAFIGQSRTSMTRLRRASFELLMGLALVCLLVFEIGVGMFAGANKIPAEAWGFVLACGAAHVVFFIGAQAIAASDSEADMSSIRLENAKGWMRSYSGPFAGLSGRMSRLHG